MNNEKFWVYFLKATIPLKTKWNQKKVVEYSSSLWIRILLYHWYCTSTPSLTFLDSFQEINPSTSLRQYSCVWEISAVEYLFWKIPMNTNLNGKDGITLKTSEWSQTQNRLSTKYELCFNQAVTLPSSFTYRYKEF